jgi:misacylated tRNA(Ala) deacylase
MRVVSEPMTDLLWMPASDGRKPRDANPNYVRSFDAKVQKTLDDWALLDRTAFYAEGGGQPSDVGTLTWDGGEAKVTFVSKKGAVKHTLRGDVPPAGATVHGEVDWDLRYKHMRMHTSQHLLSGVVWKLRSGRTAGNQIHADRSRVDFEPVKFTNDDLKDIENEVNRILAADLPILVYEEDRSVLEKRLHDTGGADRSLLGLVPQSVKRLRIVEIASPDEEFAPFGRTVDVCPCAGTHVARTGEIGRMEILGRETKGSNRERVEYLLK